MSTYKINVWTELEDGSDFECRYFLSITPGYISGPPEDCYPDESESGDPEYFLNGTWVDYKLLTPEVSDIADKMYEASEDTKKFKYKSEYYNGYD